MEEYNGTIVTEFILLGLTKDPKLAIFLLVLYSTLYILILLGNAMIIAAVVNELRLHTPMYFLLANLSLLDIGFSTVTVPRMLADFLSHSKMISFQGCITQLHFYHFLGSTEVILLMTMSYDRYVAICNPLRYNIIMNKKVCILLSSGSWITGFFHALLHSVMTSRLPFCKSNKINHFFCDVKPILMLACTSTHLNESLLTLVTGFIVLGTFLLTLTSYAYISSTLVKIRSAKGRQKAFSTCASHLTVVFLQYGTAVYTYIRPTSVQAVEQDRNAAILFTVITPLLNPLIYTLRNEDVKNSLRKIIYRCIVPERI
ncbi:olfactory receptor 12D2-like [Rhinatrema bivittatum]|uniref:olfactory receptor 12D2-like n=1 Tax=Rhinatrema bivittatum TaxID=194408 RepID=UPI00112774C6|nr:olfactory receptor 12D2-like [Rhinatrema bivittatum]